MRHRPALRSEQQRAEAEELVQTGVDRLSRGEFEAAAASFRTAIQLNPSLPSAHFGAGVALANLQQFEQAICYFKRAIELRPEFATAYLNLGLAQVRLGEDAAAMASLQRLPAGAEARGRTSSAGRTLLKARSLERGGRLAPSGDQDSARRRSGPAWSRSGHRHARRYRCRDQHLTRLLSVRPDSVDGHLALGQTYANLERWLDALPHLSRAVELAPNNHNAQLSLGKALAKNGRPDQALRHYGEAARLDPADAEAQFRVGLALVDLHREAEAVAAFAEAIRLRLNFAAAVFNLALTYYTLGRSDDARDQQRVLSEIDPNLARQLNSLLEWQDRIMIASRCWLTAASAFTIASVMVVVSSGATAGAPFDLRLVDVTADSGIDFTHRKFANDAEIPHRDDGRRRGGAGLRQ